MTQINEAYERTTVFLKRFSTLDSQELISTINKLDLYSKLELSKKIVIKPNLCAGTIFKSPSPVVTNANVFDFLIQTILLVNTRASIIIVESDSIGPGFAEDKFRNQEYQGLFSKHPQINFVDLSRSPVACYPCAGLFFKQGIILPTAVIDSDFFISLGKIKTHTNTIVSGILKNQFGCLPETNKSVYHPYLPDVLSDINSVIKPDLCVLEGCPAMEGPGPIDGSPVNMDLLIIGKDAVAADATMARIMDLKPEKIKILKRAYETGQGFMQDNEIQILGLSLEEVQRHFKSISFEQKFYVNLGFAIQRLGDKIHKFGHLFHSIQGTFWAIGKLTHKLAKKKK